MNLAPKILTDPSDLEKIKPYLDSLQGAIQADGINNIAITGSYGSGKSTILRTFQHQNQSKEYQYLNLSLASFKDNKNDKEGFERRLEISLLQQMFYHVKPSKIPDSRFKRIVNITNSKLIVLTLFCVLWMYCTFILFKFDYIESINPKGWEFTNAIDWVAVISSIIFLIGIGLFVKTIYRLFANSKINKLSIKGELELGGSVDNSVFNKHLEEILYFFERTEFNIVVIEDVDRFNSTDIFTKLREINILLNKSDLIKRPIKFLYAIRDEMFIDKTERVKFFEFIIPIIPFINTSNANDQLAKLISNANLQNVLSDDFTSDIVTFIDDIDMRLLINIFQEYQVYRNILNVSLTEDNLFAILVYKNIYPDDFGELARRSGKLYTFLTQKHIYLAKLRGDLISRINDVESQIKLLETEVTKPIKELRAVYINRLIHELTEFHCFDHNGKQITVIEAVEDEYFDEIKKDITISYYRYFSRPGYNQIRSQRQSSSIKLSDVENDISSSLKYLQREQLLIDKKNNQVEVLKIEGRKLKNQIVELENLSIKEIFDLTEIDDYLADFDNSYLMRNLLINGYINENFADYISLFHEVSLTKSDFDFERSVKAGISLDFEYELSKTENLIKRLPEKYFNKEVIFNYTLLTCLLENQDKFSDKLDNVFKCLRIDESKQFDFIHGFIGARPKYIPLFIKLLCSIKDGFWNFILNKSQLSDTEIRNLTRLIFEYAKLEHIQKFSNVKSLIGYIEKLPNPFDFFGTFNDTKTLQNFISNNKIRFANLDLPSSKQPQLFDLIYSNNHYQINAHNIQALIIGSKKEFDPKKLQVSHYSTLLKLDLEFLHKNIDANIEEYIVNVMTFIEGNNEESEETIVDILNREEIDIKVKGKVLSSQNAVIQSIQSIDDLEVIQLALSSNSILANWQNIAEYYEKIIADETSEFDQIMIDFLNDPNNYEKLSLVKLDTINATPDFEKKLSNNLLSCHRLSIEAYTKLTDSIPYRYNSINYGDYELEKLNVLLEKRILTLSQENFEGLKTIDRNLSIRLIEDKLDNFIKDVNRLPLDSDDWLSILKSSRINNLSKIDMIQKMDRDIIIKNPSISRIVCDLLPIDKHIPMDYEVLDAMFKFNYSIKRKVCLLNLNFHDLTNDQVQSLTENLGKDYGRIFVKQNKPTFPKTDYNLEFFKNLKGQDLIIRYEVTEKKDLIKVIAKY